MESTQRIEKVYKAWVVLTVAESKRLIAKGLKRYAPIVHRLEQGLVVIAKGTTNSYLVEELLGTELASGDYVNGHLLPQKGTKKLHRAQVCSEIVLKNGTAHTRLFPEVMDEMVAEDIFIKGANIINYSKGQAGVVIMHPQGGTCGLTMPYVDQGKARLIIPVGLEKDSSQDLEQLSTKTKALKTSSDGEMPYIWAIKGELFTEIEAIKQLAKVEVSVLAKGGVGGAEGAVCLTITGVEFEVKLALEEVKNIQGEPSFVE